MLRGTIPISPPVEVPSLLFLRIKILDKVESRRRELRAQDWKVKARDHRFPDGSVGLDHSTNAWRRSLGSERVTVEVGEEKQTSRCRYTSERTQRFTDGLERKIRDDTLP
jgi:hypothetical protein